MNLYYLANIRFPNEKAHGIQVREMCNALATFASVTLIVSTRKTQGEPYAFRLDPQVHVVRIFTPNTAHLGRFGFFLAAFFFATGSGLYLLTHKKDTYVLTREYFCAAVSALCARRTAWESHRGEWNWLIRFALCSGVSVIAISRGLRNFYISKGVPTEKIFVAPDGVDLSRYRDLPSREEARQRVGLPLDKTIAIYNGHLHTWKGVETLAQAARLLPESFEVIFMGGMDHDIAAFKGKYGEDPRIVIIGRKPDEERPLYLRAANVAVIPNTATEEISATYTSPLKLFGYMAAGVPIVASDLPSLREVLTEKNAFFARPDDASSLAQTIIEASNAKDADMRAETARKDAAQYGWKNRASAILSFMKV